MFITAIIACTGAPDPCASDGVANIGACAAPGNDSISSEEACHAQTNGDAARTDASGLQARIDVTPAESSGCAAEEMRGGASDLLQPDSAVHADGHSPHSSKCEGAPSGVSGGVRSGVVHMGDTWAETGVGIFSGR